MPARATVCLTFDFDAISPWLVTRPGGLVPPSVASRGEYGARVGAPRILDLLARYDIKATWFIPGHTIDTFPARAEAVVAGGHEVAHHNYCHESPTRLSAEKERQVIEMGIECIRRISGQTPTGYRAPAGDSSLNTMGLLNEFGFRYDSSLAGRDFTPYWARVGDRVDARTPYHFGEETEIVEIPTAWALDDWAYYEYTPGFAAGGRSPSHVLKAYQGEFDYMYDEVPGGVLVITMHPQVTGRGPRLLALEAFIKRVRSKPGTEFRLMRDVAEEWRAAQGAAPVGAVR